MKKYKMGEIKFTLIENLGTIEEATEKYEKQINERAQKLYDLIGTYVQNGKVLTKKEWEAIKI